MARLSLLVLMVGVCAAADELLSRRKRSFDTSDLVVDVKFNMKKNKEITGFTQEEKDNLVQIHNAYRSLVRPYPTNMVEMTWDDDIAAFAQDWANQCTATHRPNRDLNSWVNMGENLYWWYSGKYHEGMAVKYWWDEVQYYHKSQKKCDAGEVCGHYITMVWANSAKLGCGVARCDRLADLPDYGRASYYFVCNYSGRFVSKISPYKGTDEYPCSDCDETGFPMCRHNLCVSTEMFNNQVGYNGDTSMVGLNRSLSISSFSETTPTASFSTTTTPASTTTSTTTTTASPTTTPEPTTSTTTPTTTTTPEATTTTATPTESTARTTPEPTTSITTPTTTTTPEATTTAATPTTEASTEEAPIHGGSTSDYDLGTMATPEPSGTTTPLEQVKEYCNTRKRKFVRKVCHRIRKVIKRLITV